LVVAAFLSVSDDLVVVESRQMAEFGPDHNRNFTNRGLRVGVEAVNLSLFLASLFVHDHGNLVEREVHHDLSLVSHTPDSSFMRPKSVV
jgi:hypothetical protein